MINRTLPRVLWTLAVALPLLALWQGRQASADTAASSELAVTDTGNEAPADWPQQDLFHRQLQATDDNRSAGGWTLHGIQRGGLQASAILADGQGQQRSYVQGQTLAPGWQLQAVDADSVTLLGPAGPLALTLPPRGNGLQATATSSTTAGEDADRTDTPVNTLADHSEVAPRLQAGTPLALWLQTQGLRVGDELLAVDGQPLTRLDADALRQQLQGRESVRLQWRRDGQTHTSVLRMP